MSNHYYKKKQSSQTYLELILVAIGKALWWLITLPFHKGRRKASGFSSADKQYIRQKRSEIEAMSGSDNIYELKHAVIEADKLVDCILKLKGYTGETFADRLRSSERFINQASYQKLWEAHKIRNQIAHDNQHIDEADIKRAIKILLGYSYE